MSGASDQARWFLRMLNHFLTSQTPNAIGAAITAIPMQTITKHKRPIIFILFFL